MGLFSRLFKRSEKTLSLPICAAVIVAAGTSSRFGQDKPFLDLDGKPLIAHSLQTFQDCALIRDIYIAGRPERIAELSAIVKLFGFDKVRTVVKGGETRRQSVEAALREIPQDVQLVAIHDAARPYATGKLISECLALAAKHDAAIAAIPATDTVKIVNGGVVVSTPDRRSVYQAQTPQAFSVTLLKAALAKYPDDSVTDEAQLIERMGIPVRIVHGSRRNIKITYPEDLLQFAAGGNQ
ncbi:MAG: 2-C-methyl-D-erythritol 4-phosphate cytidylyltransferase [Oscillospiraceae bacterium]|jgi:2-C-methyl-D-erythritol 4-phosphate cytidylyltransferase|nr:2-C-methyl-D-erythritol 4-phosphate cytidylyltransferase [Oscillospiraceae bacterium]